jgi:hypothetical protein
MPESKVQNYEERGDTRIAVGNDKMRGDTKR